MNYFRIEESLDKKVIGRYRHQGGVEGGRISNLFQGHEGHYGPIEVINPITPIIPLHKKTILIDYFGGDNIKKYISIKFYNYLKNYLPKHQVWDMQFTNDVYKMDWKRMEYVVKEGIEQEFHPYKILHISYPNTTFLNFEESEFFIENREKYHNMLVKREVTKEFFSRLDKNIVSINSEEQYNTLSKEFRNKPKEERNSILASKLTFNNINYDIFRVLSKVNHVSGYYVSERLKNKIQEQGFTGMEFKPLQELNPHIDIEII